MKAIEHKWIISKSVDEAWLVGTVMQETMPDLFKKVLKMFYKERHRQMMESMK